MECWSDGVMKRAGVLEYWSIGVHGDHGLIECEDEDEEEEDN